MFIDWLPEVLRPWRSMAVRSKRAAKGWRAPDPVSATIETLEPLTLLAGNSIFPLPPASAGEVGFGLSSYSLGDQVTIQLQDSDLAGTGSRTLQVTSSSGDFESVVVTEVGTTGLFIGAITTKSSETTGFTSSNGLLEVPRASTISVSYFDADDGTGVSQTVTDTSTVYVFTDVKRFDFSNPDGSATTEGFTSSGTLNQWHVSAGRGFDPGHSSDRSFYFGQSENTNGGGTYAANANATLTSPEIDLSNYTGPVMLSFNTYLSLEDVNDTATVRVVTSSGSTVIASNNGTLSNLPDATGGFQKVTFDLSAFAGQKITLSFNVQTNGTVQNEGWYVDDVAITAPVTTIQGTKYNDQNGNGQLDSGDLPISGWTFFVDNNNNGMLDSVSNTWTNSTPTAITDNGLITSTVTVSNVVGPLSDLNVNLSIAHTRDADLDVYLISPNGTRIELFTDVGGLNSNFTNTTLDDQGNLSISLGNAPFTGVFASEGFLGAVNGSNPNGVWTLEVRDDLAGEIGTLLNWSITTTSLEASAVTDANGHYALTMPAGGTFNVREVPQVGWLQTSPAPTNGNPYPAQQITVPFGGNVQNVDFYNQFILPVITLPSGPAVFIENQSPVMIDTGAGVTDADSTNFANGTLTATVTVNVTVDDRVSIRSQGSGIGQIGVFGNVVSYQGVSIGTFSGGAGVNPLVVFFNANATPAAVQALLRNIQFEVVGDNPSALTRTLQIVITDGTSGASTPANKQITVTPVNDPPIVTTSGTPLDYLENSGAQPVDINATVTDADSVNFGGGYFQATIIGNEAGPVQTTQLAFTTNNAPVTLNNNTIQSPLIVSGVNGVLSDVNVTVNINHTNDPELTVYLISPNGTRVKLFSNVGIGQFSGSAQNFVNTTLDDEAFYQILSDSASAPYTGSFQPEKELFFLDGQNPNGTWNLEVTDALGTVLSDGTGSLVSWSLGLTVTETSVNEKLGILNQGTGVGSIGVVGNRVTYGGVVIGSFTGGVGATPLVVSLNTNATPAAVQSLMQNITIAIDGGIPLGGTRRVEYVINDGDGGTSDPVSRLVNLVTVNDAPVLTLPAGQSLYVESAQPTVLDTFATVNDIDSLDFDGGVLTVDLGITGQATDRLAIRSTSQAIGQINLQGTTVRYGTIAIGTVSGGINGIPLTVTFNAAATPAAVQALVRAITFQALGSDPSTVVRIAKFQVTDGDGGSSAIVEKAIVVTQLNDAPVLTLSNVIIPPGTVPSSQVSYNANGLPVVLDSLATVTDSDTPFFNGGKLTVSLISGSSGRDRLGLVSQGSIVVSGVNVFYNQVLVGRLTPGVGAIPLTVDFTASASRDAVQAVVRAVNFQIIGLNPTDNNRVAAFQLTDGSGGTSVTQTRTIVVQVANQPPVNTVPSVTFQTDEDVPVAITGLAVADPDASLLPMQVTLTSLHGTITINTAILGGLAPSQVTGNGTSRVVLFADQITINATLQTLNAVIYQGNANYSGSDQVTMFTSDLGNSGPGGVLTDSDVFFLEIADVFDSAQITPSSSIAKNTKGKEALIDSSITAKLGDGQTDIGGAILLVNVSDGRNRSDRFRIISEGKKEGQMNTANGKKGVIYLRIGTVNIGTVSGGENGKPLKIVFNDIATPADLQHVLRLITFRTAVQTTVFGMRTITYDFTDALGIQSAQATKQLNVVQS